MQQQPQRGIRRPLLRALQLRIPVHMPTRLHKQVPQIQKCHILLARNSPHHVRIERRIARLAPRLEIALCAVVLLADVLVDGWRGDEDDARLLGLNGWVVDYGFEVGFVGREGDVLASWGAF